MKFIGKNMKFISMENEAKLMRFSIYAGPNSSYLRARYVLLRKYVHLNAPLLF